MATLSPVKKKTTFIMLAGCDACGNVHPVQFHDKKDFLELRCRYADAPVYRNIKGREKVWREFQNDLMAGAVAC
jgi:hypothetical protein